MLPNDFRQDLRDRLLSFLWRQWAQLGLASAQVETRDGWVIDPESLLCITATLGRWDPRLFDEAIDWLTINARFFNVSRLKTLARTYGFRGWTVCAAMARTAGKSDSRLHWNLPEPGETGEAEALFFSTDGTPLHGFGRSDDTFFRFGYSRGPIVLRGLSRRFNPVMPEATVLRLRSLLGVSARAEILLYLLTHSTAHPSGIARETGFSQKNVQDTLVDMTASGIVHVAKLEGRRKSYFIQEDNRSPFLYVPQRPPRWVTWAPLFRSLEDLWVDFATCATEDADPLLLSSDLRQLMKSIRPGIESSGFGENITNEDLHTGEEYIEIFAQDVHRLLSALNT